MTRGVFVISMLSRIGKSTKCIDYSHPMQLLIEKVWWCWESWIIFNELQPQSPTCKKKTLYCHFSIVSAISDWKVCHCHFILTNSEELREEVTKRAPLTSLMEMQVEDRELKLAIEWAKSQYVKKESNDPKLFFGSQFLKFSSDEMVVRNDTTSDQSFQVIFNEISLKILGRHIDIAWQVVLWGPSPYWW